MKRLITITMFLALLSLEVGSSAQDQAPPAAPASQSNQPAPGAQLQTEPAAVSPTPAPASPPTQTQTLVPPPANPPNLAPNSPKQKPGTKASAADHKKVVVRNGGARDESAQLAPGMTAEQEHNSRQVTGRLLDATDANLKSIAGRQLAAAQQSQLDEIRTYMKQSKEASDSGDLARAHTLAYKARLLSDELVRK